jgi:3-hydroxyisobutyrate dehydrogenase-like beta-hydroxyacid dehydrogenase
VGLIGLGHMGTAIAERLVEAGLEPLVWNRTPEKAESLGVSVAPSVSELAASVDVVLTSLANDDALEEVAAEVAAGAHANTILVDTSTVSPEASARVAALLSNGGLDYVRAPVSGNPAVVRAGNLAFIVSGRAEAIEHVEPVLLAIGRSVHVVGEAEEARVVKLAVNLVIGGLAQLLAEALVLGESSGVSRAALLEVLGDSAAGAPFVKYKTEALLNDDFSATFTTALMEKDVDLMLDLGVDLPLTAHLKSLLHATAEDGYADHDFMALLLHLRGTEVAR